VLPLNEWLAPSYLDDQLENSVGYSHLSYQYSGRQWALAIDAAAPAASYRKDLLEKNGIALPQTWDDVLNLAAMGKVAAPAVPIDLLMNFYSFCLAHGGQLFQNGEEIVEEDIGILVLVTMKELYSLLDPQMFCQNPIAIAGLMSGADEYWYCPFAYCYSNYSRAGYAKNLLHYADIVSFNGKKLRTTIGGTGLSVSALSRNKDIAVDFTALVASGECQRTMYVQHGGQPAHLSAWLDEDANRLTHNFFSNVLPVMQNGYVRPRYNGYLHFQDEAGTPLKQCLSGQLDPKKALIAMNTIYRESLVHNQSILTA
jgi:multiple sugar transport system substrate-binding protein